MYALRIVLSMSVGGTRVAFLNMSDPAGVCPRPWEEIIVTDAVWLCVRNCAGSGCQSVYYGTNGICKIFSTLTVVCGFAVVEPFGATGITG